MILLEVDKDKEKFYTDDLLRFHVYTEHKHQVWYKDDLLWPNPPYSHIQELEPVTEVSG